MKKYDIAILLPGKLVLPRGKFKVLFCTALPNSHFANILALLCNVMLCYVML